MITAIITERNQARYVNNDNFSYSIMVIITMIISKIFIEEAIQ